MKADAVQVLLVQGDYFARAGCHAQAAPFASFLEKFDFGHMIPPDSMVIIIGFYPPVGQYSD
jgi:hypothetical protein